MGDASSKRIPTDWVSPCESPLSDEPLQIEWGGSSEPPWKAEDRARARRIELWEAAGAPLPPGAPKPLVRCFGPRVATPDQLVGEQLTVAELTAILNMSTRAVSSLASKSYRLIEYDLWSDLARMVFRDSMEEKEDLADQLEAVKSSAQPWTPCVADLVANLHDKCEHISLMLRKQSAAIDAGKGWVEPNPPAPDDWHSFLWQRVLLRKFPTHGNDLQPPRDCPILRDPADPELAFAIVKHGGRGRGNAWLFTRARVTDEADEWLIPPDFVH